MKIKQMKWLIAFLEQKGIDEDTTLIECAEHGQIWFGFNAPDFSTKERAQIEKHTGAFGDEDGDGPGFTRFI